MPPLKIVKFPNSVLQRKSASIGIIKHEDKVLLDNMLETMYLNQGVGLAAPQVGILKRAIVIDIGEGPIRLIDPVITKRFGCEGGEEGCLSLPGVMVNVKRTKGIVYKALDRDGEVLENEAEGLLARAIQHEIDHLDGRLIIDYINPIKRFFLKKRLCKTRL